MYDVILYAAECEVQRERARDLEASMNEAAENHLSELQQLKADSITEVSALARRAFFNLPPPAHRIYLTGGLLA